MWGKSTPDPTGNRLPTSPLNTGENRFSLAHLRSLHQQLLENKLITINNENLVVEVLRVIAEMVVYGDNKSELLFDFFCEKNMLSLFLEIMHGKNGCPAKVHIQILQTLSILVNCVRNDTSLYYILSNNYINDMIIFSHNLEEDESLRDQFASFMKSMSLRLNIQTVQFFFIEETGAFPLLTKAIELLHLNEPMVKIASQTTILNVYRVNEKKARSYALQDDVMLKFFTQVVALMEAQYSSLFSICRDIWVKNVAQSSTGEVDEKNIQRDESQLADILISIEDWLYYLADLIGLHINKLRKALVRHLMDLFIYPIILDPLLHNYDLLIKSDVIKSKLDANSTINTDNTTNNEVNNNTETNSINKDVINNEDILDESTYQRLSIEIVVSLTFINQILRIIPDSMLHREILVALFHPLNSKARKRILASIYNIDGSSNDSVIDGDDITDIIDMNIINLNEKDVSNNNNKIKEKDKNLHRKGLFSLLTSGNEQYTLLSIFLCHSVSDSALNRIGFGENKYKLAENEMKIFECLKLFNVKDNNINEDLEMNSLIVTQLEKTEVCDVATIKEILPSISDPRVDINEDLREEGGMDDIDDLDAVTLDSEYNWLDTLDISKLIEIDNILNERNKQHNHTNDTIEDQLLMETKDEINNNNEEKTDKNNLYLIDFISLNILENSTNYTLTTLHVGCYHLYSLVRLAHSSLRNVNQIEDIKLHKSYISLKSYKNLALNNVRKSALIVFERFNSLNIDNILPLFTIIQEELRRFHGQKWSYNYSKMVQNPLLLIQKSLLDGTGGMEYSIPICNGEIMRKEIQVFILYISLYNQVNKLCKDINCISSIDDLSLNINDGIFYPFSDDGLTSKTMIEGSVFDMKSRKFLDAYNFKKNINLKDQELIIEKNSNNSTSTSINSLSNDKNSSIFSFGFGGNSKSKSPLAPSISDSASALVSRSQRNYGEILFVQDPSNLLIISPGDTLGFSIRLVAPLLHTVTSIDPKNPKHLRIIVRSWRVDVPCMEKIGLSSDINNHEINEKISIYSDKNNRFHAITPCFLKPLIQSNLWEMTIAFETIKSCSLASQHLEIRKKSVIESKITILHSILTTWSDSSISDPSVISYSNLSSQTLKQGTQSASSPVPNSRKTSSKVNVTKF